LLAVVVGIAAKVFGGILTEILASFFHLLFELRGLFLD
jgi:uncharacterized membrane protein YeiH